MFSLSHSLFLFVLLKTCIPALFFLERESRLKKKENFVAILFFFLCFCEKRREIAGNSDQSLAVLLEILPFRFLTKKGRKRTREEED